MDSDDTKLYVLAMLKVTDKVIDDRFLDVVRSLDYRDVVAICDTKTDVYRQLFDYRIEADKKLYPYPFYIFAINQSQRSRYERP